MTSASAKRVAAGKASFCAWATDRYSTACTGCAMLMTMAGGNAHRAHWLMRKRSSEEPSDRSQHGVRIGAARLGVDHLLIVELQDQLGRRKDGDPHGMELLLARARARGGITAGDTAGLAVHISVAIERHRLPIAAERAAERDVIGDLARDAPHGAADIVGGVAVIVGAEIAGIAEEEADRFAAELEAALRQAVAQLGVDHRKAARAQGPAVIGMSAARLDIGGVIEARAAGKPGDEGRRIAELEVVGEGIVELREIAARRGREIEAVEPVDPRHIGAGRRAARIRARLESVAEILEARVDLELVVQIVHDLAVDPGRGRRPGGRDEAVVEPVLERGPIDTVEERWLVMLVGVAEGDQIDAGRADIEIGRDLEIDEGLLDFGGAVELVVIVEAGAGMLELDLRVEDDVVGELIGR